MEIMASIILYGFIAFIIGMVGKLVYEVQQNKKKDELCKHEAEFEAKEQFQKLAGIGQPKNEIDPEIWKHIADGMSKEGFPEPDPSIPITTAKLTTIGGSYEDSDPLSSVPMSRVSKEVKKKIAEIAKEDINKKLEQNAEKFATLFPNELQSELPKEIKDAMLNAPILKPKKKSNPKQMDGVKTEGEFKKTRKKTTKKPKQ